MRQNTNHIILNNNYSLVKRGLVLNFESAYPSNYLGESCNAQLKELLVDQNLKNKLSDLFIVTIVEHHGWFDKIINTLIENKLSLRKLGLGSAVFPDYDKGGYIPDGLGKDGSSWRQFIPNLFPLINSLPQLEELIVQANDLYVGDNNSNDSHTLSHNKLRSLVLRTNETEPKFFQILGTASLPNLKHLELTLGDYFYGWGESAGMLENLFDNENLNSLEHFICKSDFANDLIKKIKSSSLIKKLKTIDVSDSNLNDEGADFILSNWSYFKHLEVLNLSNNLISNKYFLKLIEKSKTIRLGDQRKNCSSGNECNIRKTVVY